MRRRTIVFILALLIAAGVFLSWKTRPMPAQQPVDGVARPMKAASPPLPMGQVILFSSGVGYFQREGEVDGNQSVDLSFPGSDVNDLLKSLVLQDMGGGHISTITYDSPDPVEKTLKSFALDLTNNPSFGQILNQARGEKIQITFLPAIGTAQTSVAGVIVGMESRGGTPGTPELELLNLLCADGMRAVNLARIQRVRFINPILEGEFKRALEVLAATHDSQKKLVSLAFTGDGKRRVRVGYVVENPIWKTSYRLLISEKEKPFLQGWAIVENTSDEDWKDVRMALVSGRPISFQLGLYEPLYVPRPWVEPELFASLRPPVYSGAIVNAGQQAMGGVGGLGGGLGLAGGIPGNQGGFGGGGLGGGGQNNLGVGGGQNGLGGGWNRYQLWGQFGQQGGSPAMQARPNAVGGVNPAGQTGQDQDEDRAAVPGKLRYEQLQRRLQEKRQAKAQAKRAGSVLAAVDPKEGVDALASAEEVGDQFQYVIDQKVSLPRQKSALLPIVQADVEVTKISIFNEDTHAKFPLLGLKFKNTSAHPLVQGPVTVYENGNYAGDARILDMQPNEERLVGYAIDLGTEIKAEAKSLPQRLVSVKILKGTLQTTYRLQQTKTYLIKNRSAHDRVLLIEHPVRPDWKLITPEKPTERSRDLYRFQSSVAAGKAAKQDIVEEQTRLQAGVLQSIDEQQVRLLVAGTVASANVKQSLQKTLDLKFRFTATQRDLVLREEELKGITDDQTRIRANIHAVPLNSDAYGRYLKKFDVQEIEIEKLQAAIKQLQNTTKQQFKEYEDYLAGLSVD